VELDKLMDIAGDGANVSEEAFLAWWADFDSRRGGADVYIYADDMEKFSEEPQAPFLALTLAGFSLAMKELAIQVVPPGPRCECASCRQSFKRGYTGGGYSSVVSVCLQWLWR